jgi:hypothetical protein
VRQPSEQLERELQASQEQATSLSRGDRQGRKSAQVCRDRSGTPEALGQHGRELRKRRRAGLVC